MRQCSSLIAIALALALAAGGVICYASNTGDTDTPKGIIPGEIFLSDNACHTTVTLTAHRQQDRVTIRLLDREGKELGTKSYEPSAEIEIEFPYTDELDSVLITCSKDDGSPFCDPVTLKFDRIYAADWRALATATHRMDLLYSGKVQVEDDSREYASGRLIVKTKEELPVVSEFHVAMIVEDDENHYFLQFEKSGDAKECAEYLRQQHGIEYVDIDSVVTISK